jgi:hypothetical protein
MNSVNYVDFLKKTLTTEEIARLNESLCFDNIEKKTLAVKAFFINTSVFNRVKPVFEPMWLANCLITKGNGFSIK